MQTPCGLSPTATVAITSCVSRSIIQTDPCAPPAFAQLTAANAPAGGAGVGVAVPIGVSVAVGVSVGVGVRVGVGWGGPPY